METKLCRMNSTTDSSTNAMNINTLNNEQSDGPSTYVQSSQTTSADLLLESPQCNSFIVSHQTSLPCTSGAISRREFENLSTDLEFGADEYTNSLNTFPPLNTATSLSSSSNHHLLNKVDNNSTALSPSSSIGNVIPQIDSTPFTHNPSTQLNTPPPSKSPDHHLETNKLSDHHPTVGQLDTLTDKVDSLLNERLTVEQLREQLTEQFNQQILQHQQINDESMSDDEESDEECSSEEEKSRTNMNSKKRSRSPHLCSKRRKQSNPIRCDFETDKTPVELEQLNQINQQFKQLSEQAGIERNELINIKNLESLQNQLRKSSINASKRSDEEEPEEGLIRKFPNTLSAAANAVARFLLSNHQSGNYVDSNSHSKDNGDPQINYTYYLAAAAAVATNASRRGTKHCLNYCKECCCPFLSTEHERLYRQLEVEQKADNKVTHEKSNTSVFAQQLKSIAQQSKLMQEIESVFGGNYEIGQVPQRNAIDAMQLIKQLESGQLDNDEAKIYQQQLVSLLNSNMFDISSNSNQMTNSLSALLTGRVFNRDAYCTICSKEFCNKYFLKTHLAKKHSIQDHQQQQPTDTKCISPTANPVQLLDEYSSVINSSTGQIGNTTNPEAYCEICRKSFCNKYFLKTHKQKVHHESVDNSTNQKSPVTSSPKRDQATITPQQQLQYELMNAIASEQHQQDDVNATTVANSTLTLANEQQKDAIRGQLSLQQMLTNPNQLQQLTAVMACESFANILRNSIVQPNSSDLSTADLAQLVNSTNTNFLFTPERLREMGVVNIEAFCRICLKEFCNKYFLKTHMANKHHIQTEDDCGSSSCDSQVNNDQNTNDKSNRTNNNSKSDMCNLDDDALEPGQCPSNLNPMDFTTLLMINNIKQQQQQQQINKQPNKEPPGKEDSSAKAINCELCSKALQSNYHLKMHRFYSHQIPFAKDDDLRSDEKNDQIDRNNNSNEETTSVAQKELTNQSVELNQQQQSILEMQQNEGLIKFQQMLKELQQHPENDLDAEVLKKIALLHKQQQQQANAAKSGEENSIYCDYCEKEFKSRSALRGHNCPGNENRLADSPNSMFSNLSAQMANTVLNNSNNSTLNYALNGDAESLVNQTGNAGNLNISSNGRDVLNNNPLLSNLNSSGSNQTNPNRLSPVNSLSQSNQLLANLTQGLPQGLPSDVTNSIFYSSTAGITLDLNKQPKFVAGRNYCNLCNKELCNKYFMKTHMMKMHNINIDEHPAEAAANSIVGGVMCDICQKELCSKYFLKVHKQNTHGIYEDGGIGIPVTNSQLITPNSTGVQSTGLSNSLVSTQSNLSPNSCGLSATNGLINRSTVANTLSPLFGYETNLSKEQLQQLQIEINKQSQLLKNGGSTQASFLEHQKSSTPVSFNANNLNNANPQQQTPSPNLANNGQSIVDRNEKELFYLQGIDPGDTSNRYFNQYTEVCPYCKRRFKSIKWMKTHVFNEHQNLMSTQQSPSSKISKQTEPSSDKIRCIFCTKLFNDNVNLHLHLVNDHRSSLEEMILARNMEIASNFGTDETLSFGKPEKEDPATRKLPSNNNESNKNEVLLSELFSQQQKKQTKPAVETKVNQIKKSEETNSDQSDPEESAVIEKSKDKISNILQMMQKKQNENNDMSGDDDQSDEEDDELLSEEEKFAAMLNNPQLQQLLLTSTKNSSNSTQPSTSTSSKIMNLYEELIGKQQQQSHDERNDQNFTPPSNQQIDDQPDSEMSDYERFSRALQQQQLLQQLQHDKLSNKLIQQQQQQARKRPNAVYTKLYQCNICEYNTRWLSNLYAHEKRRHNTCGSSQGNLKVITIRRDIPSPNPNILHAPPFRSNTQMSLNSLLNGLENGTSKLSSNSQPNHIDAELMSQLNDFNNNQNLNNSFVNQLLQSSDSSKVARPVKERTASGDGKYICTICGRTYRHKHSLQRHLVCHREGSNSSQVNKINQDNQSSTAMLSPNFKQEQHRSSPLSNDLNNSSLLFPQPSNGTSTPSFNSSTGRSSSVDSVISGEHNLKHQPANTSQHYQQNNNQLANQMFNSLNQEMLESLISGSNSSFLGNLIAGSTTSVHSPNNTPTYSKPPNDNSATTTSTNSTAMFSV